MEALNALRLPPISVLSDRRTEPRKNQSIPTTPKPKFPIFTTNPKQGLSKTISHSGGLFLLSSALTTGFAGALTYEEALNQSLTFSSDFNAGEFLDSLINFAVENPVIIAGGLAVLAVPVIVANILGKPKAWGVETAKNAYAKLGEDQNAQLVDIREPAEVRQVGSPDIRGLKKKPVPVFYKGEDKLGFLKKLSLRFKEPGSTTLFILDKFDGNSELVAELVTANGFKAAYAIKDGAEGSRGWMSSGLPWKLPKKTLSLDIGNFTDAIGDALGEGSEAVSVAVGVAAAAGLGLLVFSEVGTILQLIGSAALLQFVSQKLLFAEVRKQTLLEVDEFVNTKVAPKELVDEIKQIGKALLPSPVNGKALPAPVDAGAAEASEPLKVEAASELPPTTPQINSAPKTESNTESESPPPVTPRPLSPYPSYPDWRPPTSPTPSKP